MVEVVVVPQGTLIHIGGFPFRLVYETSVEGTRTNLALAMDSLRQSSDASRAGRKGGRARTPKKAAAARRNGRLGGARRAAK